ncbi:MAG: hypothetical protein WKF73_02235 [Nocardioidaceae bacterium]
MLSEHAVPSWSRVGVHHEDSVDAQLEGAALARRERGSPRWLTLAAGSLRPSATRLVTALFPHMTTRRNVEFGLRATQDLRRGAQDALRASRTGGLLTTRRNVEFGVRLRKISAGERKARAMHMLELVGLKNAGRDARPAGHGSDC